MVTHVPPSVGLPASGPPMASAPIGISPGGVPSPGLSGGGVEPGYGSVPPYGRNSSIPTSFPEPSIPGSPIGSSFPSAPTFQQVFKCSGCNREISQDQSKLDRCPYCKTIWVYKEDGSGRKQMTSGGVRNMMIGIGVAVVVVVLGGVAGFIGIIVAIVRAVSRPARANYRRY
jgi:DNA-directed RNA polymerase subunit RPC12/RpoP